MAYIKIKGKLIDLVRNETVKPSPTEYPPLLPTLQTYVGMVTNNGEPAARAQYSPKIDHSILIDVKARAKRLRILSVAYNDLEAKYPKWRIDNNFEACALPVSEEELLRYIASGKRVDTEQAAAMAIGYLATRYESDGPKPKESDDFEDSGHSIAQELINDPSIVHMFKNTCMWRQANDLEIFGDPHDVSRREKQRKIFMMLDVDTLHDYNDDLTFTSTLKKIRRKRSKLNNSQHLTLPAAILCTDELEQWRLDKDYRIHRQNPIPGTDLKVISRAKFISIQRLLHGLEGAHDPTSVYVRDVRTLISESGSLSPARLAALRQSTDPAAIAYSFVAAQRRFQRKVVSDAGWTRFLIKGEGAFVLQNRPDVLTSFEDILVRHATDLRALTAVSCPQGVRDCFNSRQDIEDRSFKVCEMMERYVDTFGGGRTDNLVFSRDSMGGSGRGPVDLYNALCDELADCRRRAKAAGFDLGIGHAQKFLAKDIMAWNDAWADDAFAGGKVPGWVEYLARARMERLSVGDEPVLVEKPQD